MFQWKDYFKIVLDLKGLFISNKLKKNSNTKKAKKKKSKSIHFLFSIDRDLRDS